MYINRIPKIEEEIEENKVLLIFGPRQVGKTFLVKKYIEESGLFFLKFSGEDLDTKVIFSVASSSALLSKIGEARNLFIDEAQLIPNIGRVLKLLIDLDLGFKIIVTGSSSFELMGQVGEPLVGRFSLINLFPLSHQEIKNSDLYNPLNQLENLLLFGGYPEVVKETFFQKKISKLENITNSYLLKDIFVFEKVLKPALLVNLLKLLAYQIGNEVNVYEIATKLEIKSETIERYINILEKSFIIFRLTPYSGNLRNEIKKKSKIYFYDLGIRNSLIENFASLDTRSDIGGLFENFLILERKKNHEYTHQYFQKFFWREVGGGEVDYLEIRDEKISAFEFGFFNNLGRKKLAKRFLEKYKPAEVNIVDKNNYFKFLDF